jgi:small subunit ribosomal protein S10
MKKTAKPKEKEEKEKLRLKIKACDHKLIDNSCRQIMEVVERQGGEVVGPVPLPTEFRRYTVNRSTFVHKDSREQFEMRVHKRLMDIINPNQKIIDSLSGLNLPAGVDIEIKMM